jgi:hypothetical protein
MLPLSPALKLLFERIELTILLVYLVCGLKKPKQITYYLLLGIAVCLTIDIAYYHAVRPLVVWGALNTPLILLAAYEIYVKILRKSAKVVRQKVGCLMLLLFR